MGYLRAGTGLYLGSHCQSHLLQRHGSLLGEGSPFYALQMPPAVIVMFDFPTTIRKNIITSMLEVMRNLIHLLFITMLSLNVEAMLRTN